LIPKQTAAKISGILHNTGVGRVFFRVFFELPPQYRPFAGYKHIFTAFCIENKE
jgi:hypothetical protein